MKDLHFITLLAAGLLSNVFAFGQGRKLDSLHFSKPDFSTPGYIHPPMVFKASPEKTGPLWAEVHAINSVRIMSPDRMPCIVTDLSRMEPMPVGRQRNLDNMPNAYARRQAALSIVYRKKRAE